MTGPRRGERTASDEQAASTRPNVLRQYMTTPPRDEQPPRISDPSPSPNLNGRRSPDGPPAPAPRLEERQLVHGTKPGDVAVRVRRLRGFRRRPGGLEVTDEALEPRSGISRIIWRVRTFLFGPPLATHEEVNERLTKTKGLAVLSSDALSSVAYATEEMLIALALVGPALFGMSLPLAISIVVLLAIVTFSYRQTIFAYPQGGGSFTVAREHLGLMTGLIAGAALLVNYVLTVAVSIGAGVAAIVSAVPAVADYRVALGIFFIVLITIGNLRGIRESGAIFAAPAYMFIVGLLGLIAAGLAGLSFGWITPHVINEPIPAEATTPFIAFILLRAFASGSSAMTGVEAISDGTPAFQPPEAKNAATTLTIMAVLLGIMFLGITYLAVQLGLQPNHHETLVSQIADAVTGRGPFYYFVQAATAMILILAANTAYADFPRVGSIIARAGYMPRQFAFRGDRLAFSTGILALSFLSVALFALFGGSVTALIPLYAVGLFLSFTLSQAGMVMRWWRLRPEGWRRKAVINGIGAVTTGIVALIHGTTKFFDGAWIVIALIPVLVLLFQAIHQHYENVRRQLTPRRDDPTLAKTQTRVVMPVSELSQATLRAASYAKTITKQVVAVHVTDDPEGAQAFRDEWEAETGVPLAVIESPYRSLEGPFLALVDALQEQHPNEFITVLLPEYVPAHWWEHLLHNQTALRLKAALLFRPGIVLADVPYHLQE